jgi:hypothetical protein
VPGPLIEVPTGPIDGSNRDFYTSVSYQTGSTEVWLNGQLKRPDWADGWVEVPPNRVRLNVAPEVGDVVQVFYRVL